MNSINSAAVIALVLLMDMICVFRPTQSYSVTKRRWLNMTSTVTVQCKWCCVVDHDNGSNKNNNQPNKNASCIELNKMVW